MKRRVIIGEQKFLRFFDIKYEVNLKFYILIVNQFQLLQQMVKTQKGNSNEQKTQKVHKTLREKLRKKREQQKKHKKQKSLHKKMYNAEQQKVRFFQKAEQASDNDGEVRLKKIKKYIEKFINIYEDDLDDFYEMFKTLDEAGFIDISSLQNKALYKCLKKLFKYLPLAKDKGEYRKMQSSKMSLYVFVKNKVSQAIEDYLENGSRKSESNDESSEERQEKTTKKERRKKNVKNQDEQQPQQLRLYKQTAGANSNAMGPYIPPQVRQQMAKIFQEQLAKRQLQKEKLQIEQENEFDKIFGASRTKKQMKQGKIIDESQVVPEHLMAKGSAILGEKIAIEDNEIEEYNKVHRPKKLIQLHKELKQGYSAEDANKRKPFNRERDVLGSGTMSLMSNSTFFDFKNRMTKPKTINQFL